MFFLFEFLAITEEDDRSQGGSYGGGFFWPNIMFLVPFVYHIWLRIQNCWWNRRIKCRIVRKRGRSCWVKGWRGFLSYGWRCWRCIYLPNEIGWMFVVVVELGSSDGAQVQPTLQNGFLTLRNGFFILWNKFLFMLVSNK